jgi:hypothetical protein
MGLGENRESGKDHLKGLTHPQGLVTGNLQPHKSAAQWS